MKVVVALLLIVIASASTRTTFNKLNYSKQRSITAVLAQVESLIRANSPLDAVLNILTQFRDAVNVEQVNHDEIYSIEQQECWSEDDFRSAEVQDASNVLRDSSAQLNVCQTSKIRTTNQAEVNQQQIFTYQEHLNLVLATGENEATYVKKRSRDYDDSLHAIDEALDILSGISNGNRSFAELSRVSQTMLQTSFNIQQTLNYAPIFYAFTQLAKQGDSVDPSMIEAVDHLLLQLREDIQEAYNEFSTSSAASVAAFNEQKERINIILTRLAKQEERIEDKLDHLSQCIGTQSAIAQAASNKLQRNQQLWDQAQALCATFDNEYNFATQARRTEIQLVTQLEDQVKQRFAQVDDEKPPKLRRFIKLNY